jgi:predicted alpha/beta hydrolase family esterase
MQEWVTMLAKTVGDPDAETFLVGHSLGCITILRYLETLSTQETIGGAVLISGFYEPLWENYDAEDFVRGPIDWKAVKKACLSFRVIHGKDDDIVPLPFAERLAEKLQVALEVVPGEHLGRKERLKELPAALKAVVEIAGWGGMTR